MTRSPRRAASASSFEANTRTRASMRPMTYLFETEEHAQLRDERPPLRRRSTSRRTRTRGKRPRSFRASSTRPPREAEPPRHLVPGGRGRRQAATSRTRSSRPRRWSSTGTRSARASGSAATASRCRRSCAFGTPEQKKRFVEPVLARREDQRARDHRARAAAATSPASARRPCATATTTSSTARRRSSRRAAARTS